MGAVSVGCMIGTLMTMPEEAEGALVLFVGYMRAYKEDKKM